jgi:hypothetical protein
LVSIEGVQPPVARRIVPEHRPPLHLAYRRARCTLCDPRGADPERRGDWRGVLPPSIPCKLWPT